MQFHFTVKECPKRERHTFTAPQSVIYRRDCLELLAERAANIYFYGAGGWKCQLGWPLTFDLASDRTPLGKRIVFLLNGCDPPQFEIV